jgi:hypothetical protein
MNPTACILVLERRESQAQEAAHKVGESTVELGTHYIREVLDLKDCIHEHQLPKNGLRLFFSPQHKGDIAGRAELGPRNFLLVTSHQIDPVTFENKLAALCTERGNEFEIGAKVEDVLLNAEKHTVTYSQNNEKQ